MKKQKPNAGIYGDEEVYRAYENLVKELEHFIPEERVSGIYPDRVKKMQTKAKLIENHAKNLVEATKSVQSELNS